MHKEVRETLAATLAPSSCHAPLTFPLCGSPRGILSLCLVRAAAVQVRQPVPLGLHASSTLVMMELDSEVHIWG